MPSKVPPHPRILDHCGRARPLTDHLHVHRHQPRTRYSPIAPEDRLGGFLEGTLQLTAILGIGAYGVVYSAFDVCTGLRYAVKCLSRFNVDGSHLDRRQVAFQIREIQLHYLASAHANVVSMLKIVDDGDSLFVILEFCPDGDLFYNITERGHYVGRDDLCRNTFVQILDAVEHCHSVGVFHRDLKPENILVTHNGDTVKIADFGLATSSDKSADYGCGSTFYMSPECLEHSTREPFYLCGPNDIWSLGVVLVNLTCGRNPWKQASLEDPTYHAYTTCPEYLKTLLPITDEMNQILGRIFNPNPKQRIGIPELRKRILACERFTLPLSAQCALRQWDAMSSSLSLARTASQSMSGGDGPEAAFDQEFDLEDGLSPASSVSEASTPSFADDMDDMDSFTSESPSSDYPARYDTSTHPLEAETADQLAISTSPYPTSQFAPLEHSRPSPILADEVALTSVPLSYHHHMAVPETTFSQSTAVRV